MDLTVENLCGLLIRSRLIQADDVKALYQRWKTDAKEERADTGQFSQWLVSQQYVTAYQATLLARGQIDHFFLGPYKILERLGQGRMAGVYRAAHTLGQMVAIKVLPPSRAKDATYLGRFQREARLALRLEHQNVVRAFQMGQAGDLNYLVMEYLDGETLDEVLRRRGKLPPVEGARLIYQALLGLQHIHEKGLVHRDLKPSNLMLVPAPSRQDADTTLRSTVKILDIGLGRALFDENADAGSRPELTAEGAVLGTPDYLAPEQARDAHKVDIRADIYSLGCVFYHVLTGQPPFQDTRIVNLLVRHSTEMPKPLREFSPDVPETLQQIVSIMLAKDPAYRYTAPERAARPLQVFLASQLEESKTPEADGKMQAYLQWLEKDEAPKPAAPASAETVPEAPFDFSSLPAKARKTKETMRVGKSPDKSTASTVVDAIDVELVVVEPAKPELPAPAKPFHLSVRDWLMMAVGAGAVIVVGVLGMLLARTTP
jgi:serine/threonine protein kinase